MACMDKFTRISSSLFSTILRVYPFLLLIKRLSQLDESLLRPCNNGCTFMRYWSSTALPRTTIDGTPVFITVTNGVAEVELSRGGIYERSQRMYSTAALLAGEYVGRAAGVPPDMFKDIDSGSYGNAILELGHLQLQDKDTSFAKYLPSLCPGMTPENMTTFCSSTDRKVQVAAHGNYLAHGASLKIYLVSVSLWGILRALHDIVIIVEELEGERISLMISALGLFAQIAGLSSGFFWAIGAAEVFIAEQKGCACYYEMEPLAMFTIICTPALYYVMTRNSLWKHFYAALHGDILLNVHYSVPYRVAREINKDPTYDFLLHSPVGGGEMVPRKFYCKDYRDLSCVHRLLCTTFNFSTSYIVYAFCFPVLTVRLYDFVLGSAKKDMLFKAGFWLLLFFTACAPFYVWKIQLGRLKETWQGVSLIRIPERCHLCRTWQAFVSILGDFIMPVMMIVLACKSFHLSWHLWQEREVNSSTASEIGAAGFYLLVSFLNSYVPSDTPMPVLLRALRVRGGRYLPPGGLNELRRQHKLYPGLGLWDVLLVGRKFATEKGDFLNSHGDIVVNEQFDQWCKFATKELDDQMTQTLDNMQTKCKSPFVPFLQDSSGSVLQVQRNRHL